MVVIGYQFDAKYLLSKQVHIVLFVQLPLFGAEMTLDCTLLKCFPPSILLRIDKVFRDIGSFVAEESSSLGY